MKPLRTAILLVPVLIATVLLAAADSPARQLHTVTAAVVNNDEPVQRDGKTVPLGRELAARLVDHSGDNYTWVLTDAEDAAAGLDTGEYAVAVTIPANFSAAAVSTGGTDPSAAEQARVQVTASRATAGVDPIVTRALTGATVETLNRTVVETYLDNVYLGFNGMHDQLGEAADGSDQLVVGLGELADGTGDLADGLGRLTSGSRDLANGVSRLDDGAGRVADGAGQLADGAGQLAAGLGTLRKSTATLPAQTRELADGARQVADGNRELADTVVPLADRAVDGIDRLPDLRAEAARARELAEQCETPEELCGQLREIADQLVAEADRAESAKDDVRGRVVEVRTGISALADGAERVADGTDALAKQTPRLVTGIKQAAGGATRLAGSAGQLAVGADRLADGASDAAGGAKRLADGTATAAGGAGSLDDGAHRAEDAGQRLADGSGKLASGADELAGALGDGRDRVPTYTEAEREHLRTVAATPVTSDLDLGDVGGRVAGAILVIALWVGAMLILLVVPPVAQDPLTWSGSTWRLAVRNAWHPFLLALAQAAVVTAAAQVFLGLHALELLALLVVDILVSVTFVIVNQALVAGFGNAGRMLATVVPAVTLATAAVSGVPGWLATVDALLPGQGPAYAIRAVTADAGLGPYGIAHTLAWLMLGTAGYLIATARRRSIPVLRPAAGIFGP
ncbi:YhgE/Pip family protein [Actinoplanes sp. NPDC051861]|uniref:YhgE/Pip family protein n=1 Tax=Actinoplanes sp. NPDC051861 TaxID=3155170 RepID=UPI00343CF154